MVTRSIPGMTLVAACPVGSGRGALAVSVDELFRAEEPNSVLAWLEEGRLISNAVEWNSCALVAPGCNFDAIFLGEFGEVVTLLDGRFREQKRIAGPVEIGPLRALARCGPTHLFAAGTGLQIYESVDGKTWTAESVPSTDEESKVALAIEALYTLGPGETYGVGWEGLLCLRDRSSWRMLTSPTNLDLYAITGTADGVVYACGDEGAIVKGRLDSWQLIDHDTTREKLWGIASFRGRVLVAGMQLLYELIDNTLVVVEPPEFGPFPSSLNKLVTNGNTLWSVGPKELFEFNGTHWTPLLSFFEKSTA